YALAKGAYVQDKFNSGVWWLRTQGYTGGEACNVSWAGYDSSYGHYVTMSSYGVRPVIRVKISALEKTVTDEYPNYAAVTDESSAEESSAVNSSEDTSFEQSETRSEEISDISSEESITESSEDIIIIPPESSEDGTGEEQSLVSEGSDKLEDSGTVDNKFKLIGILVCVLAALVLFKIIYGNVMRKKRY
ncbi:MAG: hypothetical protein PHW77_08340, partial [Eubacteriales bacterium]|nr:hypothetical protein [Eubacteriales bacterium]